MKVLPRYTSSCDFELTIRGHFSINNLLEEDDKEIDYDTLVDFIYDNPNYFDHDLKIFNEKVEEE